MQKYCFTFFRESKTMLFQRVTGAQNALKIAHRSLLIGGNMITSYYIIYIEKHNCQILWI